MNSERFKNALLFVAGQVLVFVVLEFSYLLFFIFVPKTFIKIW